MQSLIESHLTHCTGQRGSQPYMPSRPLIVDVALEGLRLNKRPPAVWSDRLQQVADQGHVPATGGGRQIRTRKPDVGPGS